MASNYRLAALLTCVLLGVQTGVDAAEAASPPDSSPQVNPQGNPEINEAQRLVFMNDHLGDIASGSVLNYDFSRTGKAVEAFSDTVKVKVTGVQPDGRRDLEFDFLTGPNHVDFHPAKAYLGNPVAIHFLERDIREMARRSGGDSGYFRNRIRKSFVNPEIHATKVDVDGSQLDAVAVAVTPFTGDPNVDKFPFYAKKRYEFLFAEDLPGGLYQIHTQVPDEGGADSMIDEQMTFRDLSPEG
jgi:hypothetical protein